MHTPAARPFAPTPLAQVRPVSYEDAFLIGDLLTSTITVLAGEPKAGKSLLVAGMIRALVEGDQTFLGQPVLRKIDSVVYGFTDDGADSELRSRLLSTRAFDSVEVWPMHETSDAEAWTRLQRGLVERGAGLFVLDTIVGSLGLDEDIASGTTAAYIVSRVRPIAEAGVPVLLVTHTPKGIGEGGTVASSPMGGRAIAGGTRGVIALRRSKGRGLRIEATLNRAKTDLDLKVRVHPDTSLGAHSEVPVWSLAGGTEKATGSGWDKDDLAGRIIRDQPEVGTYSGLAKVYATEVGASVTTVRQALGPLIRYENGRWTRSTPLALVGDSQSSPAA